MRPQVSLALALFAVGATLAAQQPQIQNGKVETRQTSSLEREIASIGGSSTDPVWVAWRVPQIDGRRDSCSWYNFDTNNTMTIIRGNILETNVGQSSQPNLKEPTGPVPLEAGTNLVVLARIVDKHVERLRTFGDDCPLDANGRTVYWLTGVTPADSLKTLEGLTQPNYSVFTRGAAENLVNDALSAISLHRDTAADGVLDRLATGTDSTLRRQAISRLGSYRGVHGFEMLKKLLDTEKATDMRRSIVSALTSTRQPQTVELLLTLAKSDTDQQIRADAVSSVLARGGERLVPDVLKIIDNDPMENVRTRAVSALGQLPQDGAVPYWITLAKSHGDLAVRKEAVRQLGRTKDPRAVAFLAELIK